MEIELEKQNWVNGRVDNVNIILQSKYQIELAEMAIKHCDKKIKYFEKLEALEAKKHPPKKEDPAKK
ncbi:MAG: hypothetical protein KAK00_11065 [Nanoarchaeota archaeon]|nr:hypothetical protein [Nanoarchaeota archaeon]